MTRQEKIQKLIAGGDRFGRLRDDENLLLHHGSDKWALDILPDAVQLPDYTVEYWFNEGVCMSSIGETKQEAVNAAMSSEDEWKNLDDNYLDYLLSL